MWSWFKFINLGLALGMALKSITSVKKGYKLIVRMFWVLIFTFVEVTGKKPVGGRLFDPTIMNKARGKLSGQNFFI